MNRNHRARLAAALCLLFVLATRPAVAQTAPQPPALRQGQAMYIRLPRQLPLQHDGGLAIPFDAYDRHFKGKFDLDALREAAYGRAISGPLKLPTLSRLVKEFRQKLAGTSAKAR